MKRTVYEKLLDRKSSSAAEPLILHEKNLSVKDGVTRLPLYMAPWLITGEAK